MRNREKNEKERRQEESRKEDRKGGRLEGEFSYPARPAALDCCQKPPRPALAAGADALDDTGHPVGMVGQHGLLYVRVGEPRGALTLVWGDGPDQRCRLLYDTRPNATPPGPQTPARHGAPQRLAATCQKTVTARSAPHTKSEQPT